MEILTTTERRDDGACFNWRHSIDHLGTEGFSGAAISALDEFAGVEHCSVFSLGSDAVKLVAAGSICGNGAAQTMGSLYVNGDFWRVDPTINRAKDACGEEHSVALHLSPIELPNERMRRLIFLNQEICDRVFLCGQREGQWYGFSMLRTRTRGSFEPSALKRIRSIGDALLSLVAKHDRLAGCGSAAAGNFFKSVPEIEARLNDLVPGLSRRETEVCARILRGVSTPGIAVDLNLREHTVVTYRKRAYRRLAIGTRFELMQMYLGSSGHPSVTQH